METRPEYREGFIDKQWANISSYNKKKISSSEPVTEDRIRDFLGKLPPQAVVLDAGAGAGRETEIIESSGRVPISLDMSKQFLINNPRLNGVQGDIFSLPLSQVDAVICKGVLDAGSDSERKAIVEELTGKIKPGGSICILTDSLEAQKHQDLNTVLEETGHDSIRQEHLPNSCRWTGKSQLMVTARKT